MGGQKPEKTKKRICIGILAHVDAGKTGIIRRASLSLRRNTKAGKSGSWRCLSGYL